jgi:hypothetical protein
MVRVNIRARAPTSQVKTLAAASSPHARGVAGDIAVTAHDVVGKPMCIDH